LSVEPRISFINARKAEGKMALFTFAVTLSAAYDQPVTMSFQTVNGTATTSSGDYISKSGTHTFAPGEMTETTTIDVWGDGKRESNETFNLQLHGVNANALFLDAHRHGTILNDD
jgi:hypothetical protein